jgi:hypothetical protein
MGPIQNSIIYGATARVGTQNGGQGLDSGNGVSLQDLAVVNCNINNQYYGTNDARVFQFGGPTDHLVVQNSVFTGGRNWRTDFTFTAHNILIQGSFVDSARSQPLRSVRFGRIAHPYLRHSLPGWPQSWPARCGEPSRVGCARAGAVTRSLTRLCLILLRPASPATSRFTC